MNTLIGKRRTVFDIIKEADEDTADDIINGGIDKTDNTDQSDASTTDTQNDDNQTDNTEGQDDDIQVDTSLNDLNNDDQENNEDSENTTSDDSSSDFGGSDSSSGSSEEEPIQKNTDIFANLTAEEQAIKIMELKKLFNELYTSTDDILDRINNLSTDNIRIEVLSKVSRAMYNLKLYIKDYIEKSFGIKSYIENDCKYNEFLYVYNSIANILEDVHSTNKKADKK